MTDRLEIAQELLDALVDMELMEFKPGPDGLKYYGVTEAGFEIGALLVRLSGSEDPRLLQAVRAVADRSVNEDVQHWLKHFNDRRDLPTCRRCGCTDDNACHDEHGNGCHWVEPNLCSACAGDGGEHGN